MDVPPSAHLQETDQGISSQKYHAHVAHVAIGVTLSMNGTVKWFNETKGYGFITSDDGQDVFVHYSGIAGEGFKTLQADDRVEFEVSEGPKGLQAINVIRK